MRRRPGDVFVLRDAAHFAARWMRRVDLETPERRTTAQQALDAEHDRRSSLGRVRRVAESVTEADAPVDWDFDPFNSKED